MHTDFLQTSQLNRHLTNYMPGLSAKVFRTYNASYTMSEELKKLKYNNQSPAEVLTLYNKCNRLVAELCNHKKTVSAGHEGQMKKMQDKVGGSDSQDGLALTNLADQGLQVSAMAYQADDS